MALSSVLTAAFLIGALALALTRLSPLHPVTLWCASWAAVGFLFAIDLLPYKPLSAFTALLICGATVAFAAGALGAEALVSRKLGKPRPPAAPPAEDSRALERAALTALAVTGAMLFAFLVDQTRTFGLRDTLLVDSEVRLALGTGVSSLTLKYLYVAVAGAALCALAAARQADRERHLWWLAGATACVASTYFSTGRSTIVITAAIAILAYWLGRETLPSAKRMLQGGVALAVLALTAMISIGELQGKTFENSALEGLPSAFTRYEPIQPLALPYEYASASFGALDEQVDVATTWGESGGCAVGSAVCTVLNRAGFEGAEPRPFIRPFTGPPLRWNLYTALDLPLLDGGKALALPIIALTGFGFGLLWAAVRRRWTLGLVVYAISGPTLLFAGNQFGFLTPHILGGVLIAGGLLVGWKLLDRLTAGGPAVSPG
jgi:hypothetical protein